MPSPLLSQRHTNLLGELPAAIAIFDSDLAYEYVNDAFCTLLSQGASELQGQLADLVTPQVSIQGWLDLVALARREGKIQRRRDVPFQGSGMVSYFDLLIQPLEEGRVLLHALDVSSEVESRETLAVFVRERGSEQERLRQVLDELPVAVAVYDRSGLAVVRNIAYTRLFGVLPAKHASAPEGLINPRYVEGAALSPDALPVASCLRGTGVTGEQLNVLNAERGCDVTVLINAAPLSDARGVVTGAVVVFQDITSLRAFEQERSDFFQMANHEIRTPVTALQGYLQLAMAQVERNDHARVAASVGRAFAQTKRLTSLIEDMLDLARLQGGRLELRRTTIDLNAFVQEIVDSYTLRVETHQVVLQSTREPLWVAVDRRRLEQIFENLIRNAIKFAPDALRVDVVLSRGDAAVPEAVVKVTDHGIGVPEVDREHIFERFYRSSNAHNYGGTGLGLYISRQMAQRHGGTLILERSDDTGSTFTLTLPLTGPPA